ncbi:unnamed protein product [Spirodela intermedia]|uniref:Auxin efflux carrier component n=1 Tax=Spirodela intermedia TaxID=51605 RepID=A0A7I8J3P5_SPIIN|nr:unnamed protein product [Spirodela intermedia]CAA6664876.1 unnamed protein product [Spirodela intermedia]
MITGTDFYHVMTAMVPLYVAMILAYGSVRWWKIFTPDQCSGINRFVAIFAVPLLSFHFISTNDPYTMNLRFIAADTLQKLIMLAMLAVWSRLSSRGSLEWTITLFSLSTLPNTLVMGIPLLKGMYGDYTGSLMVQIVVLQCIIWYTLMLFMYEYRAARLLITEQFPDVAGSIVSIAVDSDVVSLDGHREGAIEADAEVKEDGKVHITVRRSNASRSDVFSRRSVGFSATTPRPSNLTNAEIYSLQSFNHTDFYSMAGRSSNFGATDAFGMVATSRGPTPRPSNYYEEDNIAAGGAGGAKSRFHYHTAAAPPVSAAMHSYPAPNPGVLSPPPTAPAKTVSMPNAGGARKANGQPQVVAKGDEGGKDLHMFVWSSSASPVSDVFGGAQEYSTVPPDAAAAPVKDVRMVVSPGKVDGGRREDFLERDDFSFGNEREAHEARGSGSDVGKAAIGGGKAGGADGGGVDGKVAMPPTSVMTRLILIMVWRKLIRNPNTYSSLIGLIWSLVSCRWHVEMPAIVAKSISILSDAGLGMAMFSLGLFMALQPRIIACGNSVAAFAMAVRFLTGPAVMAAASIALGIRGDLLRISIVQILTVWLWAGGPPQGIVPFVFAKEYNVHRRFLAQVIFGMLIALPIDLIYYVLLGL